MRQRQNYQVREVDLVKLRRYNRSTKCHICEKDIEVGNVIRRARNHTYHVECFERILN